MSATWKANRTIRQKTTNIPHETKCRQLELEREKWKQTTAFAFIATHTHHTRTCFITQSEFFSNFGPCSVWFEPSHARALSFGIDRKNIRHRTAVAVSVVSFGVWKRVIVRLNFVINLNRQRSWVFAKPFTQCKRFELSWEAKPNRHLDYA